MSTFLGVDPNLNYINILQNGAAAGTGITGTLQTVQDAAGNNSALGLSTTQVTAANIAFNGHTISSTDAAAITITPATTVTGNLSTGGTLAVTGASVFTGAATFNGGITGSITINTSNITNSAVTYAKIQNMSASTLLGNPTGSGAAPSEITLGSTLAFTSTALGVAPLTGNVTTSGTVATIAANAVTLGRLATLTSHSLIGNNTGSTATPIAVPTSTFIQSINYQIFASAGTFTYTPTANMIFAIIECVGAGGAGANSVATNSTQQNAGAGGGSGAYSKIICTAATIGASQTVTVGAGGNPPSSGAVGTGTTGGNTSVGTLCIAAGGLSGTGALSSAPFSGGGFPGAASSCTGTIKLNGNPGRSAVGGALSGVYCCSGDGGASIFGGAGLSAAPATTSGGAAGTFGSGGSGAANQAGQAANPQGGVGGAGVIIITEFIAV